MIVVVLVGISAAMVAPSLMETMGISRTNRCQYDVARLLRRARADAIGTGRAHVVDFQTPGPAMEIEVYAGDSSSCQRSGWPLIVDIDAPRDVVFAGDYTAGGHGVRITLASPAGVPMQICFEPDGDRFERGDRVSVFQRLPGVITVNLDRTVPDDVLAGDVQRQIVVPQFGTPRVVR